MPDTDPGTVAPVVTPASVAPAVAATPAAPPVVLASDLPEQALTARLEQAKRSAQKELLDSLGITDPAQAKAALDAAKAAEESKKTNEQKLAEQGVRLSSLEAGVDAAVEVFAAQLKPEQKAAVDAIAGNDKASWLKAYRALAPTWATQTIAAAAAPVVDAPAPIVAPPATTSPPAAAPPPGGTTSPPDIKATYETLKQRNPVVAAAFAAQNSKAIFG